MQSSEADVSSVSLGVVHHNTRLFDYYTDIETGLTIHLWRTLQQEEDDIAKSKANLGG